MSPIIHPSDDRCDLGHLVINTHIKADMTGKSYCDKHPDENHNPRTTILMQTGFICGY